MSRILILPKIFAATTLPFEAATRRIEVTENSLKSTIITAMQSHQPVCTKQSNALNTRILSASGSANLPKSVTSPLLLAILPSNISVKVATTKITRATAV